MKKHMMLSLVSVLLLFFFLLSSCGEKPAAPEDGPDTSAPESGERSSSRDTENDPDTDAAEESEPADAKERMKKLVRDEAEDLKAELEAEKAVDPIFDLDTEPDPEKLARLGEVKNRIDELKDEKNDVKPEDREEFESLILEREGLELSIPRKADMLALANRSYPKYAYFYQVIYSALGEEIPGGIKSPFLIEQDPDRKGYFPNLIESVGNRGENPYSLLDLAPQYESSVIFSGERVGLIKEYTRNILILKVKEVFWGDLEEGQLVGFQYASPADNELPEIRDYLFFLSCDEETDYEGETIPLCRGFSFCGFEIRADGTLYAASNLRDASRLDGLSPEEGVKLVLRNYMKYYRALDFSAPLSGD